MAYAEISHKIGIPLDALLQTVNCSSATQASVHQLELGGSDHSVEKKYGIQGKPKSSEKLPSRVKLQLRTLSPT
jgi:hypothetical protein